LYNPILETELHTNASTIALVATHTAIKLITWAPVVYFNQITNKAEKKYHLFEFEMLAVIRSIERFHIYLYGLYFIVVTD